MSKTKDEKLLEKEEEKKVKKAKQAEKKKLAEEKNILLVDSVQMLRLLEGKGDLNTFECTRYLENL